MAEYDIHSRMDVVLGLDVSTIGSNTTTVGNIIDTKDFEGIEFAAFIGTRTDGSFAVLIEDGDDSGLSDAAVVATVNLIGVASALAVSDTITRVGYGGKKQFVRLSIVSTGVTTGSTGVGAVVAREVPKSIPVADQ